jgi:hypothetical protein
MIERVFRDQAKAALKDTPSRYASMVAEAMCDAMLHGDIPALREMTMAGVRLDGCVQVGDVPMLALCYAAESQNQVGDLLEQVLALDTEGQLAAHYAELLSAAASNLGERSVSALLDRGAIRHPEALSQQGEDRRPIRSAASHGNAAALRALLADGSYEEAGGSLLQHLVFANSDFARSYGGKSASRACIKLLNGNRSFQT